MKFSTAEGSWSCIIISCRHHPFSQVPRLAWRSLFPRRDQPGRSSGINVSSILHTCHAPLTVATLLPKTTRTFSASCNAVCVVMLILNLWINRLFDRPALLSFCRVLWNEISTPCGTPVKVYACPFSKCVYQLSVHSHFGFKAQKFFTPVWEFNRSSRRVQGTCSSILNLWHSQNGIRAHRTVVD